MEIITDNTGTYTRRKMCAEHILAYSIPELEEYSGDVIEIVMDDCDECNAQEILYREG